MNYFITHVTRFDYPNPVHECAMEVRLTPRSDSRQEVLSFELTTTPAATCFGYTDAFGNDVRHFDIVPRHRQLIVDAHMRVRTSPAASAIERLDPSAWHKLKAMRASGELWDFFEPSPRTPISAAVLQFSRSLALDPASDPLTSFRCIGAAVHQALAYAPHSTAVDTPLEEALEARRGVCQDFAHIALAVARVHGIPCRYVSGYFAPTTAHADADAQELATHAWVEGWFPGPGWIAIDPTHNQVAGEQHIAVAVGRDYQDAAPTKGVFRGEQAGTLSVAVRIQPDDGAASASEMVFTLPPAAPIPARTVPRADQ